MGEIKREKAHCLTLRNISYSDNTAVTTIWTREYGRLVAAVTTSNTYGAQKQRAAMMPMHAFDAIISFKASQKMPRLSAATAARAQGAFNPVVNTIALFLADFLNTALREWSPDAELSDFLFESADRLQRVSGVALANFPIYFLLRLTYYLGIEPDVETYVPGWYFDMRDVRFTPTPPNHSQYLLPRYAAVLPSLLRMNYRTLRLFNFSRSERNVILDYIIEYYSIHHCPEITSLKSLPIVREVFS